jgi:hypothetical protein
MMRITTPETLNSFEVLQVQDWMEENNPNIHYDVRSGNGCVWVTARNINLYFFFKDGQIADIQVD